MKKWAIFCAMIVVTGLAIADPAIDAALRSYVDGQSPLGELRIRYEVGNSGFRGSDVLEIAGDGTIQLDRSKNGQTQRFRGKATANTLRKLLNEMLENEVWTVPPPTGARLRDAVEIKITVTSRRNDVSFVLTSLEADALRSRRLATLIKIFSLLIEKTVFPA